MTNIGDLDFSVLDRLELELPPVGVKFDYFRPKDTEPLEKEAAFSLCEMLRECQRRNKPFYFSRENKETCIGKILLGMEEFPPTSEAGLIGQRLGVFQDARCNRNLYRFIPKLAKDSVNYVRFAPYDQLTFLPDVLVLAAKPEKAEIIMRALTYATGMPYTSRSSVVMGCSWFLIGPYKTGEANFVLPALIHGPHGRRLYDPDTVLVSVPYQLIPVFLGSLQEMPLHLRGQAGVEEYHAEFEGILKDLERECRNP